MKDITIDARQHFGGIKERNIFFTSLKSIESMMSGVIDDSPAKPAIQAALDNALHYDRREFERELNGQMKVIAQKLPHLAADSEPRLTDNVRLRFTALQDVIGSCETEIQWFEREGEEDRANGLKLLLADFKREFEETGKLIEAEQSANPVEVNGQ